MQTKLSLLSLFLILSGCLNTSIDISTTINPDGSGQVAMDVISKDGGKLAAHPPSFKNPPYAYSVVNDSLGELRAVSYFDSLQNVESPLHFEIKGLRSGSASKNRLVIGDYGLFKYYRWSQSINDLVTKDDIIQAQVDLVECGLDLFEGVMQNLLGNEVWKKSRLKKRLRVDIRSTTLQWFKEVWELLSGPGSMSESEIIEISWNAMRQLGIPVDKDWLKLALKDDKENKDRVESELKLAIDTWLRTEINAIDNSNRPPRELILPDLLSLMEESELERIFEIQIIDHFGSLQLAEEWSEEVIARLAGLFGPKLFEFGGSGYEFKLSVKMPGTLLKTNGYINTFDTSFIEFDGEQVYPQGASIETESILWDLGKVAAFPSARLQANNEIALEWMEMLGRPNPLVIEQLEKCVESWSITPLKEFVRESSDDSMIRIAQQNVVSILKWLGEEEFVKELIEGPGF